MSGIRRFGLQQLRQRRGPGLMHRGTDHGLDTLQIELAGCPAVAENDAQQLIYFAGDFLPDRGGGFFPGPTVRSQPLAAARKSAC